MKRFSKYLFFVLSIFSTSFVSPSKNLNQEADTKEKEQFTADSTNDNYSDLISLINTPAFEADAVTLNIKKKKETKISYLCNGLSVLNEASSLEKNCQIKALIHKNESSLTIKAKKDSKTDSLTIYFYQDKNGQFHSSTISLDNAKKEAGVSSETLYTGVSTSIALYDFAIVTPASKCFNFNLSWKDSKGIVFPLEGVKTKITTTHGKSRSVLTNSSGTATFNFLSNTPIIIGNNQEYLNARWNEIQASQYNLQVILESGYIKGIDTNNQTYSITLPNSLISGSSVKNINYYFSPLSSGNSKSDFGEAVEIYQSLYYYANHAKELTQSSKLTQCTFKFPAGDKDKTDYYSPSLKTIFINDNAKNNKSLQCYEAWDAFGHEYGHHIENCLEFTEAIGGEHIATEDDCVSIFAETNNADTSKINGMKLAWSESWPTFFSIVAQYSFPEVLKKETYLSIGDSRYCSSNFNANSYDPLEIEKTTDGTFDYLKGIQGGDGCELAIIRFLYQLWDKENKGLDVFTISEQQLWNTLYNRIKSQSAPTYFFEYLNSLKDDYGSQDISLLADCYHLCPSLPYFTIYRGRKVIAWKYKRHTFDLSKEQKYDDDSDSYTPLFRRNNFFYIKVYTSLTSRNPVYLNLGNLIEEKTGSDNKIDISYYPLTNEELQHLESLKHCYISITSLYRPAQKQLEDVGPIEGPLSQITL